MQSIPELDLNEAVEAEAMAQLLNIEASDQLLDELTITFSVSDADSVMERLLSDRRSSQMPVDVRQLVEEGELPPKAAFWLLDRPLPESGEGIQRDAIPFVLGEMLLFGRQTDRDARLELTAVKSDDFDDKLAAVKKLLGDLVQGEPSQEVTDHVSARHAALTWQWRFPDDTPADLRASLTSQQGRETILNRWAEVPLAAIGGKKPADAVADEATHVPILAAILLLDLSRRAAALGSRLQQNYGKRSAYQKGKRSIPTKLKWPRYR